MKYENGKDIFPERLLRQIQKYAAGKLVYIPSSYETIRKIVYSKKEVFVMEYKSTLTSAIGYARNGKLE
ncbi:MAG: hypothetical protein IJW63_10935, partial [Lachnospiraceae bacterium]|nr:hypothetical protein [Lachnospiraceae bacterium]